MGEPRRFFFLDDVYDVLLLRFLFFFFCFYLCSAEIDFFLVSPFDHGAWRTRFLMVVDPRLFLQAKEVKLGHFRGTQSGATSIFEPSLGHLHVWSTALMTVALSFCQTLGGSFDFPRNVKHEGLCLLEFYIGAAFRVSGTHHYIYDETPLYIRMMYHFWQPQFSESQMGLGNLLIDIEHFGIRIANQARWNTTGKAVTSRLPDFGGIPCLCDWLWFKKWWYRGPSGIPRGCLPKIKPDFRKIDFLW